jgi:endonuclease/exonuclease/phosphatase family metal-dependent hydrolase
MAVVEYKDFIMASVHLDLTPESRMGQAEVINDYFDTYYADCMKPIFLAGDFNATPDRELIALMKESCPLSPEQAAASDHLPVKITVHITHAQVQVLL